MKPQHGRMTEEFKKAWQQIFKTALDDSQWAVWSRLHSDDVIKDGLLQMFVKYRKLNGQMNDEYKVRFLSAVCNRLTKERNDALNTLRSLPVDSAGTMVIVDDDNIGNRA